MHVLCLIGINIGIYSEQASIQINSEFNLHFRNVSITSDIFTIHMPHYLARVRSGLEQGISPIRTNCVNSFYFNTIIVRHGYRDKNDFVSQSLMSRRQQPLSSGRQGFLLLHSCSVLPFSQFNDLEF